MAEQAAEGAVGKYLGPPISAALGAVVAWATAGSISAVGPALVSLLAILGGICGLVFTLVYRRYLGVLGANRRVPAERQAYDALRNSLAGGNLAARLYARQLTVFLDAVDRFFGDAGMADQTLFSRAFWLTTPAPLWTAPAFDRCLLLALFYPVAAIFVIWAVSGHVGPAEAALHLKPDLSVWQRGLAAAWVAGYVVSMFFLWRVRTKEWKEWKIWKEWKGWSPLVSVVILPLLLVSLLVAGAIAKLDPISVGVVLFGVVIAAGTVARGGAGAFAFCVAFVLFGAVVGNAAGIIVVADFVAGIVALTGAATVAVLSDIAARHKQQDLFLSLFLPAMILTCLGAVYFLAAAQTWNAIGPLLLFLGLLTLLNAPFDWASLGLTRALLRRGLELGGWWPYALAIVDAALAAVIIAALALTMVIGIQAFDELAEHTGGAPILPLDGLFNGIATHPTAPEYWWIYALLLSTMIPSLVNLVIGGASLLRGVPGLTGLLLRSVPARSAVLRWDRHWIAAVLTAQVALGAALGIAAQAFLVVVIIGYIMPWLGLGLLDMAREVAAYNPPARVEQLFGSLLVR